MNVTRRTMAAWVGLVAVVGVPAAAWGQTVQQAPAPWPRLEKGNVSGAPNSSKTMTVDSSVPAQGGPYSYVTGQAYSNGTQSYLMVARYDNNGNPSPAYDPATGTGWPQYWHDLTEAKLGFNYGTAIAVTDFIYVAGASYRSGHGLDYVLLKYALDGTLQWFRRYDSAGGDDIPVAIAVGTTGVYVTGTGWNSATGKDYVTVKYGFDGTYQWTNNFDGGAGLEDTAVDMVVAPIPPAGGQGVAVDGVFVVGTTFNLLGNADIVTIAYTSAGGSYWYDAMLNPTGVARLDSGGDDTASGLAVSGGTLFVTGSSYRGTTELWNYVTMGYQKDYFGLPLPGWAGPVYYNGPASGNAFAHSIAVNIDRSHGNPPANETLVYVTGQSWGGSTTGYDMATVAYSADNGAQAWPLLPGGAARFSHRDVTGGNDEGMSVISNFGGHVYVAGRSFNGSQDDYVTISYDSFTGLTRWTGANVQDGAIFYNGAAGGADAATSIRFKANIDGGFGDFTPDLWVTGRSAVISGTWYATVKYLQGP